MSPHVYWPIDVFGLSAYSINLVSQYGYDTMFMSRMGSIRKKRLYKKQVLNFVWEGHNPAPSGPLPFDDFKLPEAPRIFVTEI
jgi:hypothetical protein